MNKKGKHRHLGAPTEANRDKHINFVADERREIDPARENVKGALDDHAISQRRKRKETRRNRDHDQ